MTEIGLERICDLRKYIAFSKEKNILAKKWLGQSAEALAAAFGEGEKKDPDRKEEVEKIEKEADPKIVSGERTRGKEGAHSFENVRSG